jgi:hypothetical protein
MSGAWVHVHHGLPVQQAGDKAQAFFHQGGRLSWRDRRASPESEINASGTLDLNESTSLSSNLSAQ